MGKTKNFNWDAFWQRYIEVTRHPLVVFAEGIAVGVAVATAIGTWT
jgi:hypothetical protein